MTDLAPIRWTADTITTEALDALYAGLEEARTDLDRYEEVQGEMNETAIDLTRAVARIRALHQPAGVVAAAEHGEPPDCAVCGPNRWPCPTYQATEPAAPAATEATKRTPCPACRRAGQAGLAPNELHPACTSKEQQ